VRAALEALAAGLAAERATAEELDAMERASLYIHEAGDDQIDSIVERDTDFHDLIYKASRNQRLLQIITLLKEQIQRFRTTSLSQPGRLKHAVDEHKGIIEAIGEHNVELASSLAREHIETAEQTFLNAMGEEIKK